MAGRIEQRLAELGITLPAPTVPLANYVPFVISGNLVVVSGQVPLRDGKPTHTGKLGAEIGIEEGQAAARQCILNGLAHLRVACGGDLDRVCRVVRLGGFIACTPDFSRHTEVMDAASTIAVEVFGDHGRHARTTIGVAALPRNVPVEVEGLFEIG